MKYNLKSMVVGYEVPLLDLDDPSGQEELINKINSSLSAMDEIVTSSVDKLEMPTSNYLLILNYVFKVSVGLLTTDQYNEHFNEVRKSIEKAVEEFLTDREILYIKLETK